MPATMQSSGVSRGIGRMALPSNHSLSASRRSTFSRSIDTLMFRL